MGIFDLGSSWSKWEDERAAAEKDNFDAQIKMAQIKMEKAKIVAQQNARSGQQANGPYNQMIGNGYVTGIQGYAPNSGLGYPTMGVTGPVTTSGTSYTVSAGGGGGGYLTYPGNTFGGVNVTVGSTGIPGSHWNYGPMASPSPAYISVPAPTWNPKTGDTITYKYVDGFGWQLEDAHEPPYRAPPIPGFSMEELETAQDLIEDLEQNRRLEKA